jgi:hypothetical protein
VSTFGNLTYGLQEEYGDNDAKVCGLFAVEESASISKLTLYAGNQQTSHVACYAKAIIYDVTSNYAVNLIQAGTATAIADNVAPGWRDFAFDSPVSVGAGTYGIGLHIDANGVGVTIAKDESTGSLCWAADTYADGTAATWGNTTNYLSLLAVYATYTTAPAGFTGLTVTRLLNG